MRGDHLVQELIDPRQLPPQVAVVLFDDVLTQFGQPEGRRLKFVARRGEGFQSDQDRGVVRPGVAGRVFQGPLAAATVVDAELLEHPRQPRARRHHFAYRRFTQGCHVRLPEMLDPTYRTPQLSRHPTV